MRAAELLPLVRDLFSRYPEYRHHEPWELVIVLFSLNYTRNLEDEAAVEAAAEIARTDKTGEAA